MCASYLKSNRKSLTNSSLIDMPMVSQIKNYPRSKFQDKLASIGSISE